MDELTLAMIVKPKEDYALSTSEFDELMVMTDGSNCGGSFLVTIPVENGVAIGFMSPSLYELYRNVEGPDRMEIRNCVQNAAKYRPQGTKMYHSNNMTFTYYIGFSDSKLAPSMPDPAICRKIRSKDYDFLKTDPHLGSNIALLCVSGSRAYGLNTEDSDLDIRGCAMNSKEEILTEDGFKQVENRKTDTVIYSFNKLISLLSASNPNVLELLGLRSEDYLYISDIGQEILSHKNLFLSKQVARTFGGYANAQMKRIANSTVPHIHGGDSGKWTDLKLERKKEGNILVSSSSNSVPIQDISDPVNSIVPHIRGGDSSSGRLCKHMMHLVRLYVTCIDLLKTGEIRTYREQEHNLLMDIRNGKYLNDDRKPSQNFEKLSEDLEKELKEAEEKSELPDQPDFKGIRKLQMDINALIVKN